MCSNQYVFVLCYFGVLRALDILSDEVLVELSAAYRKMVSPLPPLKTPQSVSEFLFNPWRFLKKTSRFVLNDNKCP